MDASIIVCTYNRAESLKDTLKALKALVPPPACSWEVVVVDNNSRDHTRQVVESLQVDWPLLRYEFEGQQGLSHARNRGIQASHGEILLFTDDDVLPEPEWLENTLAGMARYQADACGGFIAPIWETPPPPWLTDRFHGFLAIRMDSQGPYPIETASDSPFGANMAFRRKVLEIAGMFDPNRGRKGAVLASGEDGELFDRILKAGLRVMWLPDARVHHKVEAFRTRKSYFRKWRYQTSRNLVQCNGIPGGKRIYGIPPYFLLQFVRALWRAMTGTLFSPGPEAFNRDMVVWHFLGTMAGLINSRHENSSALGDKS
jgi:glycosyltransferase involved in cell wall biosynthesis